MTVTVGPSGPGAKRPRADELGPSGPGAKRPRADELGPSGPGAKRPRADELGPKEQRRLQALEVNREHLLDAAEEVFGEKGFQDATIKEIAERAEFSVGAVYGIVSGKEELLAQTMKRRAVELLAGMDEVAAQPTGGLDGLRRMADVEVEFFRMHPHFGRLWVRWAGPAGWTMAPGSLAHVDADVEHAMATQAAVIRRGQAAGEIRAGDADVLARIFSGIIQAYQATDPASVGDDGDERLALADLHAMIQGAFAP